MARLVRRHARPGRAMDVHVIPACRAALHVSAAKVEAPPRRIASYFEKLGGRANVGEPPRIVLPDE